MSDVFSDHVVQKPRITGSTTINHAARVAMQLNCSEYVLMSYVYYCAKNDKPLDVSEVYQKTGFTEENQIALMQALIKKGFVFMSQNPVPEITTKWESSFTDMEMEFERDFWKKDGKVVWLSSSKAKSFKLYQKLRMKYSKEDLVNSRNEYLEYLAWERKRKFDRAIMGCEKYLNESNEYYLVDWKSLSEQIAIQLGAKQPPKPTVEPLTIESRKALYE